MNKEKIKNIVLAIVLIIALFIAYSLLFNAEDDGRLLTSESASPARGESAIVQEFISLLHTLNNLRLDTKIFEDPVFKALRDESVELQGQSRGRVNPFAPLQ